MFSSTTTSSINHFATFSSSYHHFPSLFAGYDNSVLLNYQHDPLTGVLLPANPRIAESFTYMPHSDNATTSKQDIDSLNADYYGPSSFLASYKRPSTARKDRHSKICTAQGLRDRRVRLSIEIAREFFDLQDMLGFDKASKTLEWLLIKSRNAIKEVARLKHTGNEGLGARCLYRTSECEMVSGSGNLEGTVSKSKALVGISEEKKTEKPHKDAIQHLAKESRDKARARARQRTKEKMCTRRLHEWSKGSDTSTQTLTQLRSFSQFKACEASTSYGHNMAFSLKAAAHEVEEPCCHALADLAPRADVIEDSIVLKRKLNSSTIFQQNLGISGDASCNSSSYHQNLTQNLDINSAIPHSTFRAVSNMNLSGGLQLYGKTWEARNSQCQH